MSPSVARVRGDPSAMTPTPPLPAASGRPVCFWGLKFLLNSKISSVASKKGSGEVGAETGAEVVDGPEARAQRVHLQLGKGLGIDEVVQGPAGAMVGQLLTQQQPCQVRERRPKMVGIIEAEN